MVKLSIGQEVDLEFGGKAIVVGYMGKFDYGRIYLVEFNGMKWSMKWFDVSKVKNPEAVRNNIKKNIADGSPSNRFIWAQYLTKIAEDGCFGYVMELKPDSFDSFVDVMNSYKFVADPSSGQMVKKTLRFSTLYALVTAVLNIVNSFNQLHSSGKSYQDFEDTGLFINVDTGAVLLCNCDSIAPDGSDICIGGISGYVAPEVVRGEAKPSAKSDIYMLAVILFKLMFRGNPLEGEKVVNDICLTEEEYLRHYGENAVFIYDPADDSNRPVRGIHDNVMKFWEEYPPYIREYFLTAFTDGIAQTEKRITSEKWQEIFIRLRSEIIMCGCNKSNFTSNFGPSNGTTYKCPKCGMQFITMSFSNSETRVPLYLGRKFFECEIDSKCNDFLEVAGELVENKISGILGIKNSSAKTWRVRMPDGQFHDVAPGKGCPIWKNLEIDFGGVVAKM